MSASGGIPQISIICIFLNAERFLAEALDSVLAQSLQDFELLLVDDGSADRSTAIARDYAAREPHRITYLEHAGHANRGMSASRNLGLSKAKGELICFIDSDDVWRPGKLAQQREILAAEPEVGMLCGTIHHWRSWDGGRDWLTSTGVIQDVVSQPPETSLRLYPIGQAHSSCPSDIMVRSEVAHAVGGFEERFTGLFEDQAFFAKVYLHSPVFFSSKIWLDYRKHPDSCVAVATRNGEYIDRKRDYFDWFLGYLEQREGSHVGPVRKAALRARKWVRHPFWFSLPGRLRRAAGKAARVIGLARR